MEVTERTIPNQVKNSDPDENIDRCCSTNETKDVKEEYRNQDNVKNIEEVEI